ncbi:hypothetical protein [Williamsia sp. CHRR-6]|uniref:hypothetical protein n=1 Tax=Williamsia sp. CHRR-6 TaxID=2835871 RepID=UPI001BD9DE4A|nr:hypothetical protein [Williamsia sp. CHRR-6]MBT0566743.1 hypothetical protein [Williamsia sp. CHRR-6]
MITDPTTDPRFAALRTQARAVIGYFDQLRPIALLVGVDIPTATELTTDFDRSEGVDLAALAADAHELARAGDAADQAIADLRSRGVAMTTAWTGRSATAASAAIDTHIGAATVSVEQIRTAQRAAESMLHAMVGILQTKYQNLVAIPSTTLLGQSLATLSAADAQRNSVATAREIAAKLALFRGATTRSHDAIRPMLTTLNDTLAQVTIPRYPQVRWHRPAPMAAVTPPRPRPVAQAGAGSTPATPRGPQRRAEEQATSASSPGVTRAAADPLAAIGQVLSTASAAIPAAVGSVTDAVGSMLNMVLHPDSTGDHTGPLGVLGHPVAHDGGPADTAAPHDSTIKHDPRAQHDPHTPHDPRAQHDPPASPTEPAASSGAQPHSPKLNLATDPVSGAPPAQSPPPPQNSSGQNTPAEDSSGPNSEGQESSGQDSVEPDSREFIGERADVHTPTPRGYPDAGEPGGLALAGDR